MNDDTNSTSGGSGKVVSQQCKRGLSAHTTPNADGFDSQSATLYELLQYELGQMTEDEINDAFLRELSGDDMSDI